MDILVPRAVSDATLHSTNVPENEPVWNSGTTYALNALARGNVTANAHLMFRSLQAGNLNHAPPLDKVTPSAWWVYDGPTNLYKAFDESPQSQVVFPDEVHLHFHNSGQVSAVAMLNVDASSVQIIMIDSFGAGEVYNKTFSMQSTEGINDWYAYFFEEVEFLTDKVVTDLPPYNQAQILVYAYKPGEDAKIGECVIGFAKHIGETQYGARVGIISYDRKTVNSFGNYQITPRSWARRADFQVELTAGMVDRVVRMLADFRSKAIVYIGSTAYGSTVVYGFFKTFDVEMASPNLSWCNLSVEGLA